MSLFADVALKKDRVVSALREERRLIVALSGGVDSAVLLAIAREALEPERLIGVTGRSASVTEAEIHDASDVAARLGVRHEVIETFEMQRPEYRANAGDRCLHCRTELFELLGRMAARHGGAAVAYGAIVDDLGDQRPGMKAAVRFGVLAPLLSAKICKSDIRALAKHYSLHVSEKPASACLASRIPTGTEVTPERLSQVARAEGQLRHLGFRQVRVRHHGEIARIELGAGEADRLSDDGLRAQVTAAVKASGFRFVVLDLEDYRDQGARRSPPDRLYSIAPQRDGGQ